MLLVSHLVTHLLFFQLALDSRESTCREEQGELESLKANVTACRALLLGLGSGNRPCP